MEDGGIVMMLVGAILGGICFMLIIKFIKPILEAAGIVILIAIIILLGAFLAGDLPI